MESGPERITLAVGAAATLAALTGYLALAGYSLSRSVRSDPWGTFYTAVVVAIFGAMLVATWRRNVRVAVAGGVLALAADALSPLLATPPSHRPIDPPVSALLFDILLLSVAFVLAVTVEYAARNPERARGVLTPAAVRAGVVAGLVHLAVVVVAGTWFGVLIWQFPVWGSVLLETWVPLGAFLVGALVGVLLRRYRLVTPALVVGSLLAVTTYRTWTYVQAHGDTHFPSLFAAYAILWFLVAALALGVALAERRFRARRRRTAASSSHS